MTACSRLLVPVLVIAMASPVEAQEAPADQPPGTSSAKRNNQPGPADPEPAPAEETPGPTDAPTEETAPVQSFEEDPAASTAPSEGTSVTTTERPPEDVQSFAEATMVSSGRLRFALNAFGDAQFRSVMPADNPATAAEEKNTGTFSLGTLALLINARLGAHILGTAEAALDTNAEQDPSARVERLQIRWQDEHYFVVGGRMHTDLGYWNTAYHHGPWLQLPIARPRGVRGESGGGILPIHWVGLEGGVIVPVMPGTLTVSGGVGNGRGDVENDIRVTRDTNNFKSLKLKVEYLGLGLPDLRVGGSGVYDRIAPAGMDIRPALPDEEIDEIVANAFAAYRGVNLTLIVEGFSIWHTTDNDTFTTTDAYAVGGYRFGRITPYLQVERTDVFDDMPDPFFTPDQPTAFTPDDLTEVIVGTRIDTSVWSALKGEYSVVRRDHRDGLDHAVTLNWSFGI